MFESQLKDYADSKRAAYEKLKSSRPRSNSGNIPMRQAPNETTLLYHAASPGSVHTLGYKDRDNESDDNSGWWSNLKCPTCNVLPDNSFEVMTLPVLGGVALHIHRLWLIFLLFSCMGALQISLLFAVYSFVIGGPVLFATILIHELGHASMAVYLGGSVHRILLWPLGGLAYISYFNTPKSDALVALAGPLTHIPMILVWMGLMYLSTGGIVQLSWPLAWGFDFWVALCAGAIMMQIVLCLFNLIPAYPLDGGRLFGAILQSFNVDRNKSFQISAVIGGVIGWTMMTYAIDSIFKGSFTYFGGWNLLCLSIFILYNCYELWKQGTAGVAMYHPGYDSV